MIQKHTRLSITFTTLSKAALEARTTAGNLTLVLVVSSASLHWVDIALLYFIFLIILMGYVSK